MLTRGRYANHVHLEVVGDGDAHSLIRPEAIIPPTATDLLERILARDEDNTSATTTARTLADPTHRLVDAVARYSDALGYAAEQTAGADLAPAPRKDRRRTRRRTHRRPRVARRSAPTCC